MRAADVLEFESLRKLLRRYVSSPQGFRELEKLAPHVDRERLTEDLAEAAEAVAYLRLAVRPQPAARGAAIVDIFRLENGKVVEHWDVRQDVPEKSANDNTMF